VPKRSAALLVYRRGGEDGVEVLVGHMGGPFWARKEARAWTIPKGEYDGAEAPLAAARREFEEEIGSAAPQGPVADLGELRQPGGKVIVTFAVEGDLDLSGFRSNTFTMEWPRGSGQVREFPELDRAEWMSLGRAADMLVKGQVPILDALRERLGA
jgi:predicted NUDIX family NTP pyrophosphohydrolase